MIRKILKWTGLAILFLIAGIAAATALRQHRTFEAPYPDIKASTDTAVIARGRQLVLGAGHCADCHSPVKNVDSLLALGQDPPLSGAHEFDFELGKFYASNITPDTATGIGRRTDGELARLLRHGVRANGEAALPFMPFQHLADADLAAILSYLRSTKPVRAEVPKNEFSVMGRVANAFLMQPAGPTERIRGAVAEEGTADYGRYLANSVANCAGCHTKRDGMGNFVGEPFAGGLVFEEKGLPTLVSPNLTPDPETGRITGWTEQQFLSRFRQGRTVKHSHMPWEAFGRMNDTELKAIYAYLKSLPPSPMGAEKGKK